MPLRLWLLPLFSEVSVADKALLVGESYISPFLLNQEEKKNMPNVKFTISTIERENEIFIMVRKHLEFLKTNRIRFTWPKKTVTEEYDVKKYRRYKKRLKAEWAKQEKDFTKRLLTFFQRPANLQFTVEISNYGPLGFYDVRSRTITVNLNTHLDVVSTIKHEMVHIMLEPFVQKYRLEHRRKEMIVETLLKVLE